MNVAIRNHGAPQNIFYLVQLADVIWLTVPEGAPLVCKGLYNAAREHLVMLPGARVLCGYLWSLRNKREHKFELQDDVFARTGRIDAQLRRKIIELRLFCWLRGLSSRRGRRRSRSGRPPAPTIAARHSIKLSLYATASLIASVSRTSLVVS